MKTILIILVIVAIILSIRVEIHLENTIWIEKDTGRPIYIVSTEEDFGINYKYAGDPFIRYMHLDELIFRYRYNGRE